LTAAKEIAPAKINLALHVRGKLPDGRHAIETLFAFCTDGDRLEGESFEAERTGFSLAVGGEFGGDLSGDEQNLVEKAWAALTAAAGLPRQTFLKLDKRLPIASGIGGGSADAAAALRLLTSLWGTDPALASAVAPKLGSDVPACLLSLPCRGEAAGDLLSPVDLSGLSGKPVLLVNPRVPLSTASVFAAWDGVDRGPLSDWREGRNDLEEPAIALVPEIAEVLDWLRQREGVSFARMSGSGATCFGLFDSDEARDAAAEAVPDGWWRLATYLR
jgi:4-diphosphocytidyl-2-C-methyl-D-erythritol kinase